MKKSKIEKKKFVFTLLKNFSKSSKLEEAVNKTMLDMKIDSNRVEEIRSQFLPNGFKSLVAEVNDIINEKIRTEKKPRNFKKSKNSRKSNLFCTKKVRNIE